jgi:hypothetical protein
VKALVVVALALLFVASAAHAQPADPELAAIEDAYAANRFGEMYELATALVAKRPDDAWARYLAAVGAQRIVRYDEARAHCDAGLAKWPDDPDLLGMRAQLYLQVGDERVAEVAARRALAIAPEAGDAKLAIEEIELADRARKRFASTSSGLPAGSAAAFVDAWVEKVVRGASGDSLAASLDPHLFDGVFDGEVTHAWVAGVLEGGIAQAKMAARMNGQTFLGWIVVPEERAERDTTWVDVQVPFETTFTAKAARAVLTASADPSLRGAVSPEMVLLMDGVSPEERAALVDRMVGTRSRAVMTLSFRLRGTGTERRIVDIHANGVSLKKQMASFAAIAERMDPTGTREEQRARSNAIGRVIGGVLGVGLVLYFVFRFRRRT